MKKRLEMNSLLEVTFNRIVNIAQGRQQLPAKFKQKMLGVHEAQSEASMDDFVFVDKRLTMT